MPRPDRKLTLVAYTHFGARGLRGVGMYHAVRETWRRGRLARVLALTRGRCAFDFDLGLVDAPPGGAALVGGLGRARRLWRSLPARCLGEMVFDRWAATRLPREPGVLLAMPRMVETARRARRLGHRTVLYGGQAHPCALAEEIGIERARWGLERGREPAGRARMLARFVAHVEASDWILAISDFAGGTYVRHGFPGERVRVAPLGVDLHRFAAAPPPAGPLTFLFVAHADGATGILKGLQHLLAAWRDADLDGARLVVCGRLGPEARALVERAGPLEGVEVTGPVHTPEAWYRRASVFVFPAIAEGFGKVVLEAMASARPVITTPVPAPAVRHGVDGFYVPPRDPAGLAARLRWFAEHPGAVATMGAAARERAERFTWDAFSRGVADVVAEVAAA